MSTAVKDVELLTDWYPCDTAPARVGWYDRKFVDGIWVHWWDGARWFAAGKDGKPHTEPHWRQVGDYPVWRGIRRWVLVKFDVLDFADSEPSYLVKVSQRGVQYWSDKLVEAKPFETKSDATFYAVTVRTRAKLLWSDAVLP